MGSRKQAGVLEADPLFEETLELIEELRRREAGWNGYHVAAPNPAAITAAKRWAQALYSEVVRRERPWIQPHVSSDEEGNISFEWWCKPRKLTVYVMPGNTEAIKVWGLDINTEMEETPAGTTEQRVALWRWLRG